MVIDNEKYWAQYYESDLAPKEPSRFAQFVARQLNPDVKLIELGCGNGRDAKFFASLGLAVLAVDQCATEIIEDEQKNKYSANLHYQVGDFTHLPESKDPFDVVYSRFTMHSVNYEGQTRALRWAHNNLATDGLLAIETRGFQNELYKRGEPVVGEEDAFIYEGHYRRFVELGKFVADIKEVGFQIVSSAEDTGFAPYEDTDHHFIRVIAEK